MEWIGNYQLFLFDFDGILANTEELHFRAYIRMCMARGFSLKWDQKTYASHAMFCAGGLKEAIYNEFPELKKQEPSWEVLYAEKKQAYLQLISEGVSLIEGVETLLQALDKARVNRCVVTHSPEEQVAMIRAQHPILQTIPIWFTREQYQNPKPSPECYQMAIKKLARRGDKIIGFEDSPRGLQALLGTEAEAILISSIVDDTQIKTLQQTSGKTFLRFNSFEEFFIKRRLYYKKPPLKRARVQELP